VAKFDIGVCIFALNEEKFLPYSIRSFLGCEHVKTVAVVEGCVRSLSSEPTTKGGLSIDKSAEIVRDLMKGKDGEKIVFEQLGWVNSKRDLQNRGFQIIRSRLGEGAIHMLAGADEVYFPNELSRLREEFIKHPKAKIVKYPFYHFWWRPDLICTGSSWSVNMHRAYRRPGLPLQFSHHAAPPADCGRGPAEELSNGVRCFHYTGMQDADKIAARLAFYKKRDGHRLKVTDTWSDWRWGQRTQWTHDGGSVLKFDGTHPPVIAKDVWNLTPRDTEGNLLALPGVPWDSDGTVKVVEPPKKVGIFFEGDSVPDNQYVVKLIDGMKRFHHVTAYTRTGKLSDAQQHGLTVKKFSARDLNGNDVVVVFPKTFAFRPLSAPHVAVLWNRLRITPDFSGYAGVFEVPDLDAGVEKVPDAVTLIRMVAGKGKTLEVRAPKPTLKVTPMRSAMSARQPQRGRGVSNKGGLSGDVIRVQIKNITTQTWGRNHLLGAYWCTASGTPIADAARTKISLAKDIQPGETLAEDVPVPRPPQEVGILQLHVDILDRAAGVWLNCGICFENAIVRSWRLIF